MVLSILILLVSAAAFVYWFRYVTLLILQSRTAESRSAELAESYGLEFASASRAIPAAPATQLEELYQALERDYERLARLWRKLEGVAGPSLEQLLLRLDYQLLRLWHRLWLPFSEARARAALQEMAVVVESLATDLYGYNRNRS